GKCASVHGHTYKVEVVVASDKLDDCGMVIDACWIKEKLKPIISQLDHNTLNKVSEIDNPTAENIAKYIYGKIEEELRDANGADDVNIRLDKVVVWETDDVGVEYSEDRV
ncbi:MAG: 6-pyruvoyl tetrahydropterin synthase family protein, partial [Candidatus Njordarchaeota archaeon]